MRFPAAVGRDVAVQQWLDAGEGELAALARTWFAALRRSGTDVTELLHDGMPTACVGDAAFAYVNTFKAHVNVGFFCGAELPDPAVLLQGTGKFMRHVKLRPGTPVDAAALQALIDAAYADVKVRLRAEAAQAMAG
ncbi:DUF1801 domain-containing protein [Roseateles sp.]|uniref:DUF1801 domain-containing protein n=1 Tax=Roseateles sp. TaxID=1971397 RepID=UPI0025E91B04|nr:DUF1801 domain-containing protein [Roseateles sp.]